MELELIRTYFEFGTNGKILFQDRLMMYSIELPWKDNQTGVSCIPEGRYELIKRCNDKFNRHLQVLNVPLRSDILIHPANGALKELAERLHRSRMVNNRSRKRTPLQDGAGSTGQPGVRCPRPAGTCIHNY